MIDYSKSFVTINLHGIDILTQDHHIIFSLAFNGHGGGVDLTEDAQIAAALKEQKLAWVHLDATHDDTREWLHEHVPYLDDIILDALLAEETTPRIIEHGTGCLMILRGVNLNANASPEDMISLRLWVDEERIVSLQRRELRTVTDVHQKLLDGKGPKNSGDFVSMLLGRLLERMAPVLSSLDDQLDDIEQLLIDRPDKSIRGEITINRKRCIAFKRYLVPTREIIMQLKRSELHWVKALNKRSLQESLDLIIRYIADLDSYKERTLIATEELTTFLSARTDRNLYILSIISMIFLPLGFLTGLLGINVGGIPGADNDMAFGAFLAILGGLVVLQIFVLKLLKWV